MARYEEFGLLLSKICVYVPLSPLRHTYTPLNTETVIWEEFASVFSDRRGKPTSELLLQVCSSTFLCHKFILRFLEFRCSGFGSIGVLLWVDWLVCFFETLLEERMANPVSRCRDCGPEGESS